MNNILILEDNKDIAEIVKELLLENNFKVTVCFNKKDFDKEDLSYYNLIILDVLLPDTNGFDVFYEVREFNDIPVIFLTAKDEEENIAEALNSGANDYITKPFKSKELLARINKIIKNKDIIKFKNIVLNNKLREVYEENKIVNLTDTEYKILYLLLVNKTITREMLLDKIWPEDYINDNTITVHMKRLRNKFKTNFIKTIKNVGYKLDEKN